MVPRFQFGYVPFAFQAEQAGTVGVLGHSITSVDTGGDVGVYTSMAIGADGLPIISHYDNTNDDLKVTHCGNPACTAGNTTTTVDSAGSVGRWTSLAIGSDGLAIISYNDDTNTNIKVAHCDNATCTASTLQAGFDVGAPGSDGDAASSITIGDDGLALIAYYHQGAGNLMVGHCSNVTCTAVTSNSVHTAGNAGTFPSVTIGTADHFPVISYKGEDGNNLMLAHCDDRLCSNPCGVGGTTCTTVDPSANDVGLYTSVTIGRDLLPVVSYFDNSDNDLRLLHCGNAACTAGNVATILAPSNEGSWTSITIGPAGWPVITYHDIGNSDLKMLHCQNFACTADTRRTVDFSGSVGSGTSVTFGTDGLPIISYTDIGNIDLKVAHCSNVYCIPYHRPR
jgi:hypothetical protein